MSEHLLSAERVGYHPPTDTGLEVLYLDEAMVVVNKPAGLLYTSMRACLYKCAHGYICNLWHRIIA